MHYVIRNCPCNITVDEACNDENQNETYCKDIPDCLLKRIAAECICETIIDVECRGDLAERILSELDIEECE